MEKFIVSSAPSLRSADMKRSTQVVMRNLFISLIPVIVFAIFKNVVLVGIKCENASTWDIIQPVVALIVAPLTTVICEAISLLIIKKNEIKSFKDLWGFVKTGFGWFPGLFIVLISPVRTPLWILIICSAVGEIIGKMVFGGFGQNIFNPALIGRAFMAFSFSGQIGDVYTSVLEASLVGSATPLKDLSSGMNYIDVIDKFGGLLNYTTGMIPGSLAETSVIAIIIGFIYLVVTDTIDWKIPVVYTLVVFVNTFFIAVFCDYDLIIYPLFQVLSGGLLFGAVYMATEPVTAPKTDMARIFYALFLGVLTVLFRLVGSLPEGVATSIVTMNIFGLIINKYWVKVRVDGKITKNEVPGLLIMIGLFVLLFVYNIIKVKGVF